MCPLIYTWDLKKWDYGINKTPRPICVHLNKQMFLVDTKRLKIFCYYLIIWKILTVKNVDSKNLKPKHWNKKNSIDKRMRDVLLQILWIHQILRGMSCIPNLY